MTYRNEDLQKGFEPDKCYYIQNELAVRSLRDFTPTTPPPDLVVEVDVSVSDAKLAIYAALGVPEVWLWKDGAVRSLQWDGNQYVPRPESAALPGFPLADLPEMIDDQFNRGALAVVKDFSRRIRRS